jgi:dTDP-4-amino-4,6-dideoxygalactose transaminase
VLNYSKQFIDKQDIDYLKKNLKNNIITQGKLIEKFEKNLKVKFKSKYCCVVSSGTAALHLSGIALNWKEGDIVLLSANTFVASANAVLYSRATPDLIDIDKNTFNMDLVQLENKINFYKSKGKKIHTVIATDYAGHPCDWKELYYLKQKYNFKLLNDNCHSLGSKINNDIGYAVKFADIVAQSYHPVKAITTGEGGSILTNNKKYYNRIKSIRSHGLERSKKIYNNHGKWFYNINNLGYNYRLSEINCSLGISQLKKLNKFIKKRREVAKIYDNIFKSNKNLIIPIQRKFFNHSYHLYVLQFDFKKYKISKKLFFDHMQKKGINLQVHYIPIYKHKLYKKNFNFSSKDFPICEKFYNSAFSIPNYYTLSKKDIDYVSKQILNFFYKI